VSNLCQDINKIKTEIVMLLNGTKNITFVHKLLVYYFDKNRKRPQFLPGLGETYFLPLWKQLH